MTNTYTYRTEDADAKMAALQEENEELKKKIAELEKKNKNFVRIWDDKLVSINCDEENDKQFFYYKFEKLMVYGMIFKTEGMNKDLAQCLGKTGVFYFKLNE